jgi:hypothetical protein
MEARAKDEFMASALPAIAKIMAIVDHELSEEEKQVLSSLLDQLVESTHRANESIDRMLAFEEESNQRMALMEARRVKEAPWAL